MTGGALAKRLAAAAFVAAAPVTIKYIGLQM